MLPQTKKSKLFESGLTLQLPIRRPRPLRMLSDAPLGCIRVCGYSASRRRAQEQGHPQHATSASCSARRMPGQAQPSPMSLPNATPPSGWPANADDDLQPGGPWNRNNAVLPGPGSGGGGSSGQADSSTFS
jgi:hypothetical protein